MLRIEAPHFVAGVVLFEDTVTQAAPILRYMQGWKRHEVIAYCSKRRWAVAMVGSQ